MIILLVIVKISDDFSSCALMQLIHVLVRPYASTIHNIFDGIVLQLIVIISVLPVIELVDEYDETFIIRSYNLYFPIDQFHCHKSLDEQKHY